ncbi:MAG: hypothetical protein HUK25_09525 [Treponema sp.]|nr:hypothetical protein [Clostridia bacterium]MCF0242868.1 hypothetical protein [Treponema sp.]
MLETYGFAVMSADELYVINGGYGAPSAPTSPSQSNPTAKSGPFIEADAEKGTISFGWKWRF